MANPRLANPKPFDELRKLHQNIEKVKIILGQFYAEGDFYYIKMTDDEIQQFFDEIPKVVSHASSDKRIEGLNTLLESMIKPYIRSLRHTAEILQKAIKEKLKKVKPRDRKENANYREFSSKNDEIVGEIKNLRTQSARFDNLPEQTQKYHSLLKDIEQAFPYVKENKKPLWTIRKYKKYKQFVVGIVSGITTTIIINVVLFFLGILGLNL